MNQTKKRRWPIETKLLFKNSHIDGVCIFKKDQNSTTIWSATVVFKVVLKRQRRKNELINKIEVLVSNPKRYLKKKKLWVVFWGVVILSLWFLHENSFS